MAEREDVYGLVLGFFDGNREKADLWMRTPNPLLGGISADDLIQIRPGKVLRFVKQALAENER